MHLDLVPICLHGVHQEPSMGFGLRGKEVTRGRAFSLLEVMGVPWNDLNASLEQGPSVKASSIA